jgi:hypothetical protein
LFRNCDDLKATPATNLLTAKLVGQVLGAISEFDIALHRLRRRVLHLEGERPER